MAPKPTQIETGPALLKVKSPFPGTMEKALRRVMPRPMADFVFGAVVYELQAGDVPNKKPPTRGHTYGGGENVSRAWTSPMQDTYPDDEFGFDTIDLMLKTGTVRFALELKKAAILSALFNEFQWQIECQDGKLGQIVAADMKRIFATYGIEMLSMLEYGSFFGELIWEYVPASMRGLEGNDKWWVLEGINTVKPETVDHINRVKSGKNRGRFDGFVQKANLPWEEHTVPVEQALILSFRKKWRNLWGESILKAAYPLWYWFDIILAAFIRYLGRSGIPLTKCTAPMKGRMKTGDGEWLSTMDYALLVATEATRSEAVALPSDRDPETGQPLFTLDYLTDDKRGDQFIGALKFVADLLTRSIIMGAMADISKEGGGFNREEMRWGMTQLDNQQILAMMTSQLARYHLPKYAIYNATPSTHIDMLLVGLDPERIDRAFKFLSTAGNQKDGGALDWPDWALIFQLSGIPTLSEEEVEKIKKEREEKALKMQQMMKEKKVEEEGPSREGEEEESKKEKKARKEVLEEVLWEVLINGSPVLLSTDQLEGIAKNNPDLFQEETTIELYNPYHDALGKFTTKAGAVAIAAYGGAMVAVIAKVGFHKAGEKFEEKRREAQREYRKTGSKQALVTVQKYEKWANAMRVGDDIAGKVSLGLAYLGVSAHLIYAAGTLYSSFERWQQYRPATPPKTWPGGVDQERAHKAYRNFAKCFHPDVAEGMTKEQANEKFIALTKAYEGKDWKAFQQWSKETGVKLEEWKPSQELLDTIAEDQALLYRILKDALDEDNEWILFDINTEIDWLPEVDGMYLMSRSQAQYIISIFEEAGKTPMQAFRELKEVDANLFLYNPYHDELGRFASKERAVTESHAIAAMRNVKYGPITGRTIDREKFEKTSSQIGKELSKRLTGYRKVPIIVQDVPGLGVYYGAYWMGDIYISSTAAYLAAQKEGMGRHTLIHESIHARERTNLKGYLRGGWEEEGTTELIARKMYKDIYGKSSPSKIYSSYVERVGRMAWQQADGDPEKAWEYIDALHNKEIKHEKATDGTGWEAMLDAKYKFEEEENDLMDQLLELIEKKKWDEAKAFVEEHPDPNLQFVFGEAWIQEFGIEEK